MRRESKLYSQTQSSRELDTDQVEARWIYQRYGRSSTLDNIDPSSAAAGFSERFGSPLSDDEQPPFGILTSATGHIRVPQSQQQSEDPCSNRTTFQRITRPQLGGDCHESNCSAAEHRPGERTTQCRGREQSTTSQSSR